MRMLLKTFRTIYHLAMYWVACCVIFQSSVHAQPVSDESVDCNKVQIDYSNDPTLTREERIRRMDKAFYDSLEKFKLCQDEMAQSGTAGGGAGGGGNGSNGNEVGSAQGGESGQSADAGQSGSASSEAKTGESTEQSTASSTMSGSTSQHDKTGGEQTDRQNSGTQTHSTTNQTNTGNRTKGVQHTAAGGQRPTDIPPSDNDSALAAQIRYAAEKETDPVKKAQLWNEYRKYKGLPLK